MRVSVRKINNKAEEQVIIECVEITQEIKDIHAYVEAKGMELVGTVEGEYTKKFALEDVYYFEALDEKVFAYTKDQVYELKMRLYEVEQAYEGLHFIRCSKSVVLNLMLLDSISPALSGRFIAHMKNGEKLMISRQYAPRLKQVVMGGNKNEIKIKNDRNVSCILHMYHLYYFIRRFYGNVVCSRRNAKLSGIFSSTYIWCHICFFRVRNMV